MSEFRFGDVLKVAASDEWAYTDWRVMVVSVDGNIVTMTTLADSDEDYPGDYYHQPTWKWSVGMDYWELVEDEPA